MKKLLTISTILLSTALSTGCDVNPSKFGADEAQLFARKITYVRDHRTNLCFALVASRETADVNQTGMGMSEVPCEAVERLLE